MMKREKTDFKRLKKEIYNNRYIYLLLSFGVIFLLIFAYVPMRGILLAFKQYKPKLGIMGSPWVGLKHFRRLFSEPEFFRALKNTLIISVGHLLVGFAPPIILAILISELGGKRFKKISQTILTFPHFLSWVIVAVIAKHLFEYDGVINQLLGILGMEPQLFLANKTFFRPLLYISSVWKEAGWSSIIYLAAIAAINPELHEAACVDGANRLQRIIHITLPGIRSMIVMQLLLSIGGIMSGGGFDQVFNMYNTAVLSVGDNLSTYIYRITFEKGGDFGFSTAVGLFSSVVNFSVLMVFNRISRKVEGHGLIG